MSATAPRGTGEVTVRLRRLTMVAEDDGVTIGRPDTASYAVFPDEGARAIRMLDAGVPVSEVGAWYERTYGESLDMADFLGALDELGFLLADGEEEAPAAPVRWQRLGRWTFSWPAWVCYAALIAAAVALMVGRSWLRPSYHDVFFTGYLSLIPVVMTAVQVPCILLHEGFHSLAGRRLGLPSTLGISRRLYYLVAETRLASLLSVPRRRRYLPFLAGMLADTVLISLLTLLAVALDGRGVPRWCSALCLAVAFSCVLRLVWQVMFYLETDLYYVLANALRCSDLHSAARFRLRVLISRTLRRPPPRPDTEWSERDLAMARWYAPVLVAGYGFSLGSLVLFVIPASVHFVSLLAHRFGGTQTPLSAIADSASFLTFTSLQFGLAAYVARRDRRARGNPTQGALT